MYGQPTVVPRGGGSQHRKVPGRTQAGAGTGVSLGRPSKVKAGSSPGRASSGAGHGRRMSQDTPSSSKQPGRGASWQSGVLLAEGRPPGRGASLQRAVLPLHTCAGKLMWHGLRQALPPPVHLCHACPLTQVSRTALLPEWEKGGRVQACHLVSLLASSFHCLLICAALPRASRCLTPPHLPPPCSLPPLPFRAALLRASRRSAPPPFAFPRSLPPLPTPSRAPLPRAVRRSVPPPDGSTCTESRIHGTRSAARAG